MAHASLTPPPTRTAEAHTGTLARPPASAPQLARTTHCGIAGRHCSRGSQRALGAPLAPAIGAALVLLLPRVSLRFAFLLGLMFGLGYTLALTAWMRPSAPTPGC